jgi:hypothetical protein
MTDQTDDARNITAEDEAQLKALADAISAEREAFEADAEAPEAEVAAEPRRITPQLVLADLAQGIDQIAALTVIITDRAGTDHIAQTTMPPAFSTWHENVLRVFNTSKLVQG